MSAVVLGYDESPGTRRALAVAVEVAARFSDQLVLVFASEPPGGLGEEWASHREALREQAREGISHAKDVAAAAGVPTVVELVDAKPPQALVEVADRYDARMIVVGSWGDAPIRGAILGSTPHKLLHLSRHPVLCVPAAEE